MNYPSAIIVAAGLVAGALVFSSQGFSPNEWRKRREIRHCSH